MLYTHKNIITSQMPTSPICIAILDSTLISQENNNCKSSLILLVMMILGLCFTALLGFAPHLINASTRRVRVSVRIRVRSRIVSSEISPGKFPEIYSNLSGNLLKNVFHFIL